MYHIIKRLFDMLSKRRCFRRNGNYVGNHDRPYIRRFDEYTGSV